MKEHKNGLFRKGITKELAFRKYSLPLSVKTLHLDVCSFDITDSSSTFSKPLKSSVLVALLELDAVDASSAIEVDEHAPTMNAAKRVLSKNTCHISTAST